ncbi:MAG TPA: transposase [Tepidisphaeraceae bacterium]|jgi:hypothetical protein
MGTKLHLATEANGLPIGFVVTGGNRNECPAFGPLVEATRRNTPRHRLPGALAADIGIQLGPDPRLAEATPGRHRHSDAGQ